jgi:hypothetical protein
MQSLNNLMSFGHVVQIHEDGSVTEPEGIYGAEVVYGFEGTEQLEGIPDGWDTVDGFSGQDRYSGPVMHNSEYIGGGLERYILDTPGYYCTAVVYWPDDETSTDQETYSEGWVILYKETA